MHCKKNKKIKNKINVQWNFAHLETQGSGHNSLPEFLNIHTFSPEIFDDSF